jgi:hypothetical protein
MSNETLIKRFWHHIAHFAIRGVMNSLLRESLIFMAGNALSTCRDRIHAILSGYDFLANLQRKMSAEAAMFASEPRGNTGCFGSGSGQWK